MKRGDKREEKEKEEGTPGSRAVTTPRRCDAAPLQRHAVGAPCRFAAAPLLPRASSWSRALPHEASTMPQNGFKRAPGEGTRHPPKAS